MSIRPKLESARASLPDLLAIDGAQRAEIVRTMARCLRHHQASILAANMQDITVGEHAGLSPAMLDRLRLDSTRIEQLACALESVSDQPDPLRDDSTPTIREDGLRLRQVPAPLGVIAMVYESRPNVTADAAALCLLSGNACVLRGGREARHSNQAIAAALHEALRAHSLPESVITVLDDPDRSQLHELLDCDDLIDVVIPRGGEGLIRHVAANSKIPVIRHYKGVCHLYVDRAANVDRALQLLIDGKTSRPGVCNALECLLVHADIAAPYLSRVGAAMRAREVTMRACNRSLSMLEGAQPATRDDWGHEYLDRILAVRIVDDLDAALAHIRRYGSNHTEVIVSDNAVACARFVQQVDASAVMVNASSRFNDGGELGLGAEIGISTTKLHAYGPMGLASLTCRKWVVEGEGHVRHAESRG